MTRPRLLIGMPAFRATDCIHEALQSITAQDYRDFRVLISIDANDRETAAACDPYLADSRFDLVSQERRLGWAGNLNFLMAQPDYDFFCYWQHDDFTTPDYLGALLRSAEVNPAAVCQFTGIQWLGEVTDWMPSPSVTGLAVSRALYIFESLNGIPIRGLIRKDAIERVGPIRKTAYESAFEEFVWTGKLAREGNLRCVEGPIYYKRARETSTHAKWHAKDRLWRRGVWLEFGMGMLETLWPVVPETDRVTALGIILDRLCVPRDGRSFFYDGPAAPLAADFVAQAIERFQLTALERAVKGGRPDSFAGSMGGELLDGAVQALRSGRNISSEGRTFQFRFGDPGIDLLLGGWSPAEGWGTWSVRSRAGLRLPVAARRGRWRGLITFQAFGREGMMAIEVAIPSQSLKTRWQVPCNQVVQQELEIESELADVAVEFDLPEAVSPAALGMGDDRRLLGIGLISLDLTEPG